MAVQSAEWIAAARLVRRAGFGATGATVDAVVRTGRSAYVSQILAAESTSDPGVVSTPAPEFAALAALPQTATAAQRQQRNRDIAAQLQALTAWWIRRMVAVRQPLGEKLTFGWHNHFATAVTKVREASWMLQQNQTLRRLGRGDFRSLALTMLTDAAMLRWLDAERNTAAAPNENLSREFMELFALGHGNGYTETDVREGARALTGWQIRADGTTHLVPNRHDNGTKTLLGVTGNLDVNSYCDAVLGAPAGPAYLIGRWWGQLASSTAASSAVLSSAVTAYGPSRNLTAMFTAIFTSPAFTAAEGTIVCDPVEWLIGAVRALKVPVADDAAAAKLVAVLRALGQVPFSPPSVGGWPSGQAWLSTIAADTRMQTALTLVKTGDISTVTSASMADRVDAAGYLLGIGDWSARSRSALQAVAADPHQLVALALNTAEYLVH